MKAETDPITDDEWLLRRVHFEKFKTDEVPIITPSAFDPRIKGRDPDTDGISLFREACLADPVEVLATIPSDNRHLQGIVRVAVSFIKSLGLSVESKPDERVKGHVVIPELNAAAYKANKARFTPIKLSLATEASKEENIVRWPDPTGGGSQAAP
jgi:hypothetical protein